MKIYQNLNQILYFSNLNKLSLGTESYKTYILKQGFNTIVNIPNTFEEIHQYRTRRSNNFALTNTINVDHNAYLFRASNL